MKYRHYIDALQTKDHQILQAGWLQRLVIRIFAAHLYAFIGRIFHYAYKRGRIRSAELHALLALTERALWQRDSGRYAAKNSDNAELRHGGGGKV